MSKGAYIGVDSFARSIVEGYMGVDTENLVKTAINTDGSSLPYVNNSYINSSGSLSTLEGYITTGFIPFDGRVDHIYRVGGEGINLGDYPTYVRIAWYNADMTIRGTPHPYNQFSNGSYQPQIIEGEDTALSFSTASPMTNPSGAAFFRLCIKGNGANLKITLDKPLHSVARKIKNAYIGIGGVARPCWSAEKEILYYGTITALNDGRHWLAATSFEGLTMALFAGGSNGNADLSSVDAYNQSLVHSTPSLGLNIARSNLAAAPIGKYILFGGGSTSGTASNVVDAYDQSLTRSTPTALSVARYELAAASNGLYAVFGGGEKPNAVYSNTVDAYNSSLTRSIPATLSAARTTLAAVHIAGNILFGGGRDNSAIVDVYNTSLTHTTAANLSVARRMLKATRTQNHALFAGGYTTAFSNIVDIYDSVLTKSTANPLSVGRTNLGATILNGYALFGGGSKNGSSVNVDVYNNTLTHSMADNLSEGKESPSAATVGNYALFGGGYNGSNYSSVVDVYTPPHNNYTNQLVISTGYNSTAIYNSIGYKNGKYLSSSATPYEGTDSAFFLTGYIPYTIPSEGIPKSIYIKGALWTTDNHARMNFFKSDKTITGVYIVGDAASSSNNNINKYFTIETLGNNYYKFTPIATGSTSALVSVSNNSTNAAYFRLSLKGNGEGVIITVDEPIK